jgi:hypothetical protein
MTHRCTVQRMRATSVDGAPVYSWTNLATDVHCRLDLSYVRRGKDESWTQEAGRAPDRTGVLFMLPDSPLRSGDRVVLTFPKELGGVYTADGAIDPVIDENTLHHFEIGVTEVPGVSRSK